MRMWVPLLEQQQQKKLLNKVIVERRLQRKYLRMQASQIAPPSHFVVYMYILNETRNNILLKSHLHIIVA